MHSITSEDSNFADVADDLAARLTRFNEMHAGALGTRHIALTVRNDVGNLIAGLTAEVFWNAMHVDLLWVDEEYRRQGYGTLLLQRAEDLALQASCGYVYLSTFEFQAPGFYSRQGYRVIGELKGVPVGSRRQWFCKGLLPTPLTQAPASSLNG